MRPGCVVLWSRKNLSTKSFMMMIDKSMKKLPIARIVVDAPYYSREVEALCLSDAIYDLVIGNFFDARPPNDPNLLWQTAVCDVNKHTRKPKGNIRDVDNEEESAQKTIEKTQENEMNNNLCDISRTKFVELQINDVTINKLENANKYITEDDIKYRLKFNMKKLYQNNWVFKGRNRL